MEEKIKVLWLSDFACSTGFAQVAHNILERLYATGKYEFDVIGINHHGEPYDFKRWPFPIYPAQDITQFQDPRYRDLYGRQRLLDMLGTGKYDIVFTLQDTFIIEDIAQQIVETKKELQAAQKKGSPVKVFSWIFYYPLDSEAKENWITKSAALADVAVTYTHYAKRVSQKYLPQFSPEVIYHGINLQDFYPLSQDGIDQFKAAYFKGKATGKFLVTCVNRNQIRKDIPRTIAAFAKFHMSRPDSLLYLHMAAEDSGGNVFEMARHFGLRLGEDYLVPKEFDPGKGYPVAVVNQIYNASDVVISTTLGEGWGLSSTEAMATKTPILFPDNTSLQEICADGRCRLVECGNTANAFICHGAQDVNQFRPITDIEDMAAALADVYTHPKKYQDMAAKAYEWVQTLSWDILCAQWEQVFERALLRSRGSLETHKIGRNDPCPQCGVKWKKCKAHNPELHLLTNNHAL